MITVTWFFGHMTFDDFWIYDAILYGAYRKIKIPYIFSDKRYISGYKNAFFNILWFLGFASCEHYP